MPCTLFIITGRPGVGKTTLAHRIADDLRLPVICKDELKEIIFDSVGYSDAELSRSIGHASYRLMDYLVQSLMKAGQSLIIESNFDKHYDSERLAAAINAHQARAVQIVLHCDEAVRADRYKQRNESGSRHPGHQIRDGLNNNLPAKRYEPLDIPGTLIERDTTDFKAFDYAGLIAQLR